MLLAVATLTTKTRRTTKTTRSNPLLKIVLLKDLLRDSFVPFRGPAGLGTFQLRKRSRSIARCLAAASRARPDAQHEQRVRAADENQLVRSRVQQHRRRRVEQRRRGQNRR